MNVEQLVNAMTPEVFTNLKQAVETGKWTNGAPLTEEQKANSLQMVMLYQAKVERSNEHMTIGADGEMVHKSKSELRNELRQAGQAPIAQVKLTD